MAPRIRYWIRPKPTLIFTKTRIEIAIEERAKALWNAIVCRNAHDHGKADAYANIVYDLGQEINKLERLQIAAESN
jgi:hypothetical protein